MAFTTIEIANLLRKIMHHLVQNKETCLTAVGIFRVSGIDSEAAELLKDIAEAPVPIGVSGYGLSHAIKYLLRDKVLMTPSTSDLGSRLFQGVFLLERPLESLDVPKQADKLKDAVIALCQSKNVNEKIIGEVVYRYFHLATCVTRYSDTNKMDARNMGLMLGPIFMNNIQFSPLHYDEATIGKYYLYFSCLSEAAITAELFTVPFEEAFSNNALSTWKQIFTDTCELRSKQIRSCKEKIYEMTQRVDYYNQYLQNIDKQSVALDKKLSAAYLEKLAEEVQRTLLMLEGIVTTQKKQLLILEKQAKEQDKYSDGWLAIANITLPDVENPSAALTPAFDAISLSSEREEQMHRSRAVCYNRARF